MKFPGKINTVKPERNGAPAADGKVKSKEVYFPDPPFCWHLCKAKESYPPLLT